MSVEAYGNEAGDFSIERDGLEVVHVPIVTSHEGATVCEFGRKDRTLSRAVVVTLIREHLLKRYLGGEYDEPTLELVDLDDQCWARGPASASFEAFSWTPVAEGLPTNIASRKTGLPRLSEPASFPLRSAVEGFGSVWTAACASPDGRAVATAHGEAGTVWITRLADGHVEHLPPCGAPIISLAWGVVLVALQIHVPHVHVLENGQWSQRDLGTGPTLSACWSPDGMELAFACSDGHVRVIQWATRRVKLDIAPGGGEAIHCVRCSPDGQRLFVGHAKPRISVHRAIDGELIRDLVGTLHFQARFSVGPAGAVAASLFMNRISVFDGDGVLEGEIANPAAHGLTWGGFARGGRLLVTECNEGWVKAYRRSDRALVGCHETAKEPLVVLNDCVVVRDPKCQRLEVRVLPE